MKNGIHNLLFRAGRKKVALPCQVKNGFRDRIMVIDSLRSVGLNSSLVCWLIVMLGIVAVFAFAPEHGAYITAIIPALKIDTSGLDVNENKAEIEFLNSLKKRVKIEGDEAVSQKDFNDTMKVLKEESNKLKDLNVDKLKELLDENKGAMASLVKQGLELTQLKQNSRKTRKSWRGLLKGTITDKAEDMVKHIAGKSGGMMNVFNGEKFEDGTGVVQKAGTITTSVVTTDSGGNALLDLMSVEDLRSINLQEPFIERFSNVIRTSKPVYPYADFEPNSGDAAFTAENAAKSQMDLKVVVKTVTPKKVTGYQTLSTEVVEDVPRMQSEATNYMLRKVLLKRQYKILFGTGAGQDPIGVAGKARTYNQAGLLDNNGAALSGSLILNAANGGTGVNPGVQDANLYDAITAAALQIYSVANYTDEEEYYPNLVILNPTDVANLKLRKNAFNQYLFPELQFNRGADETVRIDNLVVIAKRQVPVGKIMIGDFTRLNIINYIDYTLRLGWIDDNLINNLFTMVGETRFFTVIRELDRNAFLYDDIQTILNSIARP